MQGICQTAAALRDLAAALSTPGMRFIFIGLYTAWDKLSIISSRDLVLRETDRRDLIGIIFAGLAA